MKELCIDVRMALSAGIGTYIRNIVPLLADSFKLILIANESSVQKWPFLNDCNVIMTRIPIYSIEEQVKLPLMVPSCDLFWTPHYNTPFLPLRAKKRIVSIHDVYHLAFSHDLSYIKRFYAKVMINRAAKISDHILTISHFSKDEIVKHTSIEQDKISVIHLGVDRFHFSEKPEESRKTSLRQKYGLPLRYFIFVSTLSPHKNIERLFLAWNLVREKFPEWKLVLVGKRGKTNSWEQMINNNPSLQESLLFLGQVEDQDLPDLYRNAYAMIHPSLYEGFGLTPLEAMSCGCPAIVSKVASLPEVCGESALYVDPYNIKEIAQGIVTMIENPELRDALRVQGLQRSKEFSWTSTVKNHLDIMGALS